MHMAHSVLCNEKMENLREGEPNFIDDLTKKIEVDDGHAR